MSDVIKIYKVKNKEGKWSSGTACPHFSSKGKIWHNIGHVKAHISNLGQHIKDIAKEWEIVEFIIPIESGKGYSVEEYLKRKERSEALTKKYGPGFAKLVENLESKELISEVPWVIMPISKTRFLTSAECDQFVEEITGIIKANKLKMNKDYRRVKIYNSVAYAFGSKSNVLKIRLSCKFDCQVINLDSLEELNVDKDEAS